MTSPLRNSLLIILFTLFFANHTKAQPRVGKYINVSVGLGLSSSYNIENYGNQDELEVDGDGFFAQGEYIIGISKWFGIRPYAGLLLTSSDGGNPQGEPNYKITTDVFMLGAKARLCAPIPYVAPFIELGIGTSIGSFHTFTPSTNYKKSTVLMHVPVSFGLAVGRHHNIELALSYYMTPAANQISGAVALGYSFPIN